VRDAGISVCAGGIIGLGEEEQDRVGLLLQLATLPEHPESVPINRLVAVKGTPLQVHGVLQHCLLAGLLRCCSRSVRVTYSNMACILPTKCSIRLLITRLGFVKGSLLQVRGAHSNVRWLVCLHVAVPVNGAYSSIACMLPDKCAHQQFGCCQRNSAAGSLGLATLVTG
jgi:hypothetical protein